VHRPIHRTQSPRPSARALVATAVAVGLALSAGCGARTGLNLPPPPDASTPDAPTVVMTHHPAVCNPTTCTEGCDTSSGKGPVKRVCVIFPADADSGNECDGHHDTPGFPANGTTGNGFDDNCNGLVDEGCSCTGAGTTKPCYLVPASQTVEAVPVGWCAENSKGTVDCAQQADGSSTWSGNCRGAQPPLVEDTCAPGDFDCDGKAENPTNKNCNCQSATIACPTAPLTTIPYPPANNLPLQVDAAAWFSDPSFVSSATDWQWTLTGGDCDNILPHPSFGIYPNIDGTEHPSGTQSDTLGTSGKQHGVIASEPAVTSAIYPAFSLSGDYLLAASWTLDGVPYTCSVKIQVRAPGLRAEGCWSTENQGDDLDLHMAKASNFPKCAGEEDWSDQGSGPTCEGANEDCYYGDCLGFASSDGGSFVDWGYDPGTSSECDGWGSQAEGTDSCNNPRLDRDANGTSGICDPNETNPNGMSFNGPFCGSENINLDNPNDGDVFAVAMRFYTKNGNTNPNPHVNIYCNGARVLSAGYDPVAGNEFPQMINDGGDTTGDMWKVGLVTTQVSNGVLTCNVAPTPSQVPDVVRDGSSAYCVDNYHRQGANSQVRLTKTGDEPTSASQLCFH